MAKDKNEIVADIKAYIGRHGGNPREWYIGSANDPKQTLNKRHRFKDGDVGLVRTAKSEQEAADVVRIVVADSGTVGDANPVTGPGRKHIYLYKRQPHTNP